MNQKSPPHDVSDETRAWRADITPRRGGWSIASRRRPQLYGGAHWNMDILIYEEDHLTRALLQQWLSEAGYCVHVATRCNAQPASRADLVIVNVYMPKQAGAQCIRMIRAAHPDTPVIAISAQFRSGLSAAGATAQSLDVQRVIAKPLVRSDVLEAVRSMTGTLD